MTRYNTFTFRVDENERKMIEAVASRLERTQSDAMRLLLRSAYEQIVAAEDQQKPEAKQQ